MPENEHDWFAIELHLAREVLGKKDAYRVRNFLGEEMGCVIPDGPELEDNYPYTPSKDWCQCGELIEAMRTQWKTSKCGRYWEFEDCEEHGWQARILEVSELNTVDDLLIDVMADTLPKAICLAACKATGYDENGSAAIKEHPER